MDESQNGNRWAWWLAYGVCAIAAALPFLTTYRLPMADLPQHAVQLTVWKFFHDPCYRFDTMYEVNWPTPYLAGTLLMHAVAALMSVQTALKLIVYVTIVALPLVLLWLSRSRGLDPWLALLGFPLGFGLSFYWGFINFSVIIPLILILLGVVCAAAEKGGGRAILVALLSILIAAGHALAYGFALILTAPILLFRLRAHRSLWMHIVALIAPVPLLAFWVLHSESRQARARAPWEWDIHPRRFLQFFEFLLSAGGDASAFWVAVLLIGVALLLGIRPAEEWWRWIPFLGAAIAFLVAPYAALGQIYLYPRLDLLVVSAAVVGLRPRAPVIPARMAHALVIVAVLVWMLILAARFSSFHHDADGFDRIVDAMPSNQRVLLLETMQSEDVSGYPFLHFSGYYLERKGGVIGWSFASNFPTVIRYRAAVRPGVPQMVTYMAQPFDWTKHSNFDFFIVRAPADLGASLFRASRGAAQLRERAGSWWLYENLARAHPPQCPPLERNGDHSPVLNLRW